jgi:hypothetical protein
MSDNNNDDEEIDLSDSLENYELDKNFIFKINNEPAVIPVYVSQKKKKEINGSINKVKNLWIYDKGKLL